MQKGSRVGPILLGCAILCALVNPLRAGVNPFLPACTALHPGNYRVEAELLEVSKASLPLVEPFKENYSLTKIKALEDVPSTKCLASPMASHDKSGAILVDITRRVTFSKNAPVDVGIKLSVSPHENREFSVALQYTTFAGFADSKALQPIFNHQRIDTKLVSISESTVPSYAVILLPESPSVAISYDATGRQSFASKPDKRQILVMRITEA